MDGHRLRVDADPVAAHRFLTGSYWAKGIALDTVDKAIANSIVVSIWKDDVQVAMARVVSDRATFAYVQDVYVLDDHRGQGLSKVMMARVLAHPELQNIGRWALFTKDAQGLYEQFGWRQYPWPERMMIIDAKCFPHE